MKFYTVTKIEAETLDSFHQALASAFESRERLCVIFNSDGGCIDAGFAYINLIKKYQGAGANLKAILNIKAASIATPVFLAFDYREAMEDSYILMHSAAYSYTTEKLDACDADSALSTLVRDNKSMADYIESRTEGALNANKLIEEYSRSRSKNIIYRGLEELFNKKIITLKTESTFPLL